MALSNMLIQIFHLSLLLTACCFTFSCTAAASGEHKATHRSNAVNSSPNTLHPPQEILTLDNLIDIALKHNQMLEVVRQKVAQSQGRLIQARSGYLPSLTIKGRYNYTERKDSAQSEEYDAAATTAETIIPDTDETERDDVVHGLASLSQLIYDFGRTTGGIDVGRSNLKAADAHLQRQVQTIIFQVKEAYYSVLEKKRLIEVAVESVKNFQQHLDRAKVYHQAGVRTRIDVINAEVELSNAKMRLLRAKYNFKTARVALAQVLGIQPNQGRYNLYSNDISLDNILASMPPLPDTLDNLIEEAINERPDILQLTLLTEAAKANLVRIKGNYWPSISAEATYSDYDTDLSLYKDSWEVGVACTWELFSGFHTQGAAAEALGLLLENKAQLQDLQLTVTREVTDSYLQTDENREGVQIALQTLELARENLLLAEKRYQSGAYDVIEFNDAQLSLTRTQNELVVTYYGYLTALAGIEHAVGRLSERTFN